MKQRHEHELSGSLARFASLAAARVSMVCAYSVGLTATSSHQLLRTSFTVTHMLCTQRILAAGQARLPVELFSRRQAALHACMKPNTCQPRQLRQQVLQATSKHMCPGKC